MTYIVINNVRLAAKPTIQQDFQINEATKPYIGGVGSYVNITGEGGRKLEIPVHATQKDINAVQNLRKQKGVVTLVSPSAAKYNGKYKIIDLKTGERKRNIFDVTITVQEHIEPNIVRRTFANWKKPTSTTSTKTSSSIVKALNKCPTLKYGMTNSNCVNTLQKALKRCGYYVSVNGHSLLLDGDFLKYTLAAVKAFQKKKKLKVDGIVGPKTKAKLNAC
ncbi:peptidoglycan-binding domain-containing protein [Methanobacterium sp.]|uniref:peptidoglycan-binding domain-containing protein n=1 Tax=Methanobacterium sp. TaxID=2164 RepID=UPI003C71C410